MANIIVDPAGTGDYTTIRSAFTGCTSGDTLLLRRGVYDHATYIYFDAAKTVTIKPEYGVETLNFNDTGAAESSNALMISQSANITFENILFNFANANYGGSQANNQYMVYVYSGATSAVLKFKNCSNKINGVYTPLRDGLLLNLIGMNTLEFDNCDFAINNATTAAKGHLLYWNETITNMTIKNSRMEMIEDAILDKVNATSSKITNLVVTNNFIKGTQYFTKSSNNVGAVKNFVNVNITGNTFEDAAVALGGEITSASGSSLWTPIAYAEGDPIHYDGAAVVPGTERNAGATYIANAVTTGADVPGTSDKWDIAAYTTGTISNNIIKDVAATALVHGLSLFGGCYDFTVHNNLVYGWSYQIVLKSLGHDVKNCVARGIAPIGLFGADNTVIDNCTFISTTTSYHCCAVSAQNTGLKVSENCTVKNSVLINVGSSNDSLCVDDLGRCGSSNVWGLTLENNVYYKEQAGNFSDYVGTTYSNDASGLTALKAEFTNDGSLLTNPDLFVDDALTKWMEATPKDSSVLAMSPVVGGAASKGNYATYKKKLLLYNQPQNNKYFDIRKYEKGGRTE